MKQAVERLKANSQAMRKRHLLVVPDAPHAPPAKAGHTRGFRRYKVSSVGQITLPAAARQNWGIERGGIVEVANLGFAVLIIPEGGAAVLLDRWLAPSVQAELEEESQDLLTATLVRSPKRSST